MALEGYTLSLEQKPTPNILAQRAQLLLLQADELALHDFEESIRLFPDVQDGRSHFGRGYIRAKRGAHAAAVRDAEEALRLGPHDHWEAPYNSACVYGQAAGKAQKDQQLSNEERTSLAQKYTARTLELIKTAGSLLPKDGRAPLLQALDTDEAFEPIRNDLGFQKLVRELRAD